MHQSLDRNFIKTLGILLEKSLSVVTATLGFSVSGKEPSSGEDFAEAVICSIGITGPFSGNLIIILSEVTACKLVSRMVSDNFTQVTDDVLDGCRELTNMVAGGIMMGLSSSDSEVNIGLPTSLRGHKLHMRFNPVDKHVHQLYSSEIGNIEMIIVGRENESPVHEQQPSNAAENPKNAVDSLLDKMKHKD